MNKDMYIEFKLDLESIGSSLGFEGELTWAGLDWRGPDISSGLVNRHLTLIIGGWVVGGL